MKVKLFKAVGLDEIDKMEHEMNDWLGKLDSTVEPLPQMGVCSVTGLSGSEEYLGVVVSIWY